MVLYYLTQALVAVGQVAIAIFAFTSPHRDPAISQHLMQLNKQVHAIYQDQSCTSYRNTFNGSMTAANMNQDVNQKINFTVLKNSLCKEETYTDLHNCVFQFDQLFGNTGRAISNSMGTHRESSITQSTDTLFGNYCRNETNTKEAFHTFAFGVNNLAVNYDSQMQFPIMPNNGRWNVDWFELHELEVPEGSNDLPQLPDGIEEPAPSMDLDYKSISKSTQSIYKTQACTTMRDTWKDCEIAGTGEHDFTANETAISECLCPLNATREATVYNEKHSEYMKSLYYCTSAINELIHPVDINKPPRARLSDHLVNDLSMWCNALQNGVRGDGLTSYDVGYWTRPGREFPILVDSGLWNSRWFYIHGLEAPEGVLETKSQSSEASRNGLGLGKLLMG